jgi:hypothetical protein
MQAAGGDSAEAHLVPGLRRGPQTFPHIGRKVLALNGRRLEQAWRNQAEFC